MYDFMLDHPFLVILVMVVLSLYVLGYALCTIAALSDRDHQDAQNAAACDRDFNDWWKS